ncbi:hypothetical protein B0H99_10329 [Planomicrobium soli]|uniref:Lipoprotein n=1 Tax=Planomicrobium soli TaxID=1176648 RepID=A0A2P8H3V3_9BACL|nr:hypothetical protein [Planomicrobium soli]PSL40897.1 hypothetical protein B0H99_10329 [Planomicrobium soli]
MKRLTVLMTVLLFLSACGNGDNRYNFSGSSKNWDMFYVVNVSNGDSEEKNGTIKFTGSGEAPETINYKIATSSGGSEGIGITLEDAVGKTGNGYCSGCAVIQKDEEIEVQITWNGQTENFVLTNKN